MKKYLPLSVLLAFILLSATAHTSLRVATYNLRNANPGDSLKGDGWYVRRAPVAELIRYHDFDIFGTQELIHRQITDMAADLPAYAWMGVARDDGAAKGEYSAIFYKKERLEKLHGGDFWLSPTPDRPGLGWDAACIRICTWGHFRDRATDRRFWFFNLHMDHIGVQARRESARLVLAKIKEMCGSDRVILTGDFNVDQRNESYVLLRDSGILADCYEAARVRYALNGTFNAFNPEAFTDERIDHIFVSPAFGVEKYAVLTDTYRSAAQTPEDAPAKDFPAGLSLKRYRARVPSDHFPVTADLSW